MTTTDSARLAVLIDSDNTTASLTPNCSRRSPSYLVKSHAAFDSRDYGHPRLGELVRAESYVDVKDVAGPTGPSQLWVRLKPRSVNPPR